MEVERAWHAVLLVLTLFGVASLAILALGPLVFGTPPPSLSRLRPVLVAIAAVAAVGLALEWRVIH